MEDKRASDNLILKCTQEIKRDQRTEESPMGLQDEKTGNLGLQMTRSQRSLVDTVVRCQDGPGSDGTSQEALDPDSVANRWGLWKSHFYRVLNFSSLRSL